METRKTITGAVVAAFFAGLIVFASFAAEPAEGCIFSIYIVSGSNDTAVDEVHVIPDALQEHLVKVDAKEIFRVKVVFWVGDKIDEQVTLDLPDGEAAITLDWNDSATDGNVYYTDWVIVTDVTIATPPDNSEVIVVGTDQEDREITFGDPDGEITATYANVSKGGVYMRKGSWMTPNRFWRPAVGEDDSPVTETYAGIEIYTNADISGSGTNPIIVLHGKDTAATGMTWDNYELADPVQPSDYGYEATIDIIVASNAAVGQCYDLYYPDDPAPENARLRNVIKIHSDCEHGCAFTSWGDPVIEDTGEFLYTHTDVSLSGKAIGFSLTRTYKSRVDVDRILGFNWDHSANKRLVKTDAPNWTGNDGDVTYLLGNLQEVQFLYGTKYYSPPSYSGELTHDTTNHEYTITFASGTKQIFYDFDDSVDSYNRGKLYKIEDSAGNDMEYAYYSSTDFVGLLYTVTLDNNETVTFTYVDKDETESVDAKLDEVEYPFGDSSTKTIKYHYDDAVESTEYDLVKVEYNYDSSGDERYIHYKYSTTPSEHYHNITEISNLTNQSSSSHEDVEYYVKNYYVTSGADLDKVDYQTHGGGDYGDYNEIHEVIALNEGTDPSNPNIPRKETVVIDRKGYVTYRQLNVDGDTILERLYWAPIVFTGDTGQDEVDEVVEDAEAATSVRGETGANCYYETRYTYCECGGVKNTFYPEGNVVENTYYYDKYPEDDYIDPRVELNLIKTVRRTSEGSSDDDSIIVKRSYVQFFKEIGDTGTTVVYDGDGTMDDYELAYNVLKAVSDPRDVVSDENFYGDGGSDPGDYGDYAAVYYYDFEEDSESNDYNGDGYYGATRQTFGNMVKSESPLVKSGLHTSQTNDYRRNTINVYNNTTGFLTETRTEINSSVISKTETEYYPSGAKVGKVQFQQRYVASTAGYYLQTEYDYYDDGRTKWVKDARGLITYYEYDAMGRTESVKYNSNATGTTWTNRTQNIYDYAGNLWQVLQRDQDGNDVIVGLMIYDYDVLGNKTDQWLCHTIPDSYAPDNSSKVSDAKDDSVHTEYEYDANENLVVTKLGASGSQDTTGTIYDERNMTWQQLVDVTFTGVDPTGTALVSYFYDGNGNLTAQHDGRQTPSYPITPEDQTYTTTYIYDGFGRRVASVSPQYSEGESDYYAVSYSELDKAGLAIYGQIGTTDTRPDTISEAKYATKVGRTYYKYDELNRRYEATTEDLDDTNYSTTRYYANIIESGEVKSIVEDPTELESYTLSDWLGRTVSSYDPAGNNVQNFYDDDYGTHLGGNLEIVLTHEVNDGDGNYYSHYQYDSNGRLVKTGNSGTTATINWGTDLVTTYAYDDLGRTVLVTDPEEVEAETTYNDAGQVASTIENEGGGAKEATTTFVYDDKGRRKYVQDDEGKITYYTYKQHYGLPEYTYYDATVDGSGDITDWENGVKLGYDTGFGKATSVSIIYELSDVEEIARTLTYDYDNRGMMTQERLTSGTLYGMQAKTFEYDALGRMVLARTHTDATPDTDNIETEIVNSYDSFGRLTSQVQGLDLNDNGEVDDTGGEKLTVTYNSYDDAGRLLKIYYPDGRKIELYRTGDDLERVLNVKDITGTPYTIATYAYVGSSRVYTRTYDDQSTDTELEVTYDEFLRVTDFKNTKDPGGGGEDVFARFGYAYDDANNRTSEQYDFSGSPKYDVFVYDGLYQITQAKYAADDANGTGADRTTDFTLDTVNNRTAVGDTLGTNGTEHDASYTPNDLHQYTGITYGGSDYVRDYDEAGNLKETDDGTGDGEDDDRYYHWDYNDKLAKITTSTTGGALKVEYVYDAIGRRVLKDETTDTRYIYNGWQCIEEYVDDSGFDLTRTYVYGNSIDEVLQVRDEVNEDNFYYHTNVQGNVVALTDDSGTVVETYDYDIYGRLTAAEAWDDSSKAAVALIDGFVDLDDYFSDSVIDNVILFQGRRLDGESALYYFRNRQYDPVHGRFLSRDPLGYTDSYCLYQFVNNNPICYTDPMGEWVDEEGDTVSWEEAKKEIEKLIEEYKNEEGECDVDELGVWETIRYLETHLKKGRYVWTKSRGFLDFRHVFAAAVWTDQI